MKKLSAVVLLLFTLVVLAALPTFGKENPSSNLRSTYIIVFNESVDVDRAAYGLSRAYNLSPELTYRHAIKGMSAQVPEGRLNGLRNDPRVAYVEEDQPVSMFAQTSPTGVQRIFADENSSITIDGSDDVRIDADVAVIDTGVDMDHSDINLYRSTNCARGGPMGGNCKDGEGDDGNGHGTHVAGTIGAIDNGFGVVGVAPGARIWSVRVLDNSGSGWMSWIIGGVDWVTAHSNEIDVANMSLGCECSSDSLDTAISNSVASGVTYAVAAGNSDKDASSFSPANHPDVITVSALADFDGESGASGSATCRSDEDDTLANFSNWGSEIEITAPGVCILSTWNDGGYYTISGTSMASPHTAGAAALLYASGTTSPSNIRTTLINNGNFNWVDDSGDGIQEPLLDVSDSTVFSPATTSGSGDTGGDTNSAPTADFTYITNDLTVDFTDESGDTDGSISSWSWDFGDESGSTEQNPSHTYSSGGTYTVTLTVTDDDGASDSVSQDISVSDSTGDFSLTATGYKVKGTQHADLSWSGATSTSVDVYRNGSVVDTTVNDGEFTDSTGEKGGGSATYQICEAGTTTCSNEATANF